MDGTDGEWRQIAWVNLMLADLTPNLAVAIVAPTETILGLIRTWQTYVESSTWKVEIFLYIEDAEAWLLTVVPDYGPQQADPFDHVK
jgi:hypothetical protein